MNLTDQIKRDEGLRLTAYKDSLGKVTIGYGRCLETKGISREEAEYLLANDIDAVRIELTKAIPWMTNLNEPRQAVLYNMAFNMGIPGLLKFKNFLSLMERGLYSAAAVEMLHSLWANQVAARATRLSLQVDSGDWR